MSGPSRQRLILASASPRREMLLRNAGFDPIVVSPPVDDAKLVRGQVSPTCWVAALAYLKARAVGALQNVVTKSDLILAADTVCVHDGCILGQPRDAAHAHAMIARLRNATHHTITGVCILGERSPNQPRCVLFCDTAEVTVGHISDTIIATYIESGNWRGKAGGYNLDERLAEGWPIECKGDPATVMGLPIARTASILRASPA